MREIKFRAYAIEDLTSSQWIENGYGITKINYTDGTNSVHILTPYGDYHVVEESVGQYTGLKDRNGKEIYEGDILLYLNTHKSIVNYKDGAFIRSYRNGNPYLIYDSFIEEGRMIDYEVTGNIYENPEILEG